MATLHEKKVQFNSKLTISNTGGNLSTDSGLVLVKEFMESLNFSDLSKQYLGIEDKRLYHIHDNFSLMEQLIYQNIAGYSTDSSANLLKQDPIFKVILDKSRLASQSSISRGEARHPALRQLVSEGGGPPSCGGYATTGDGRQCAQGYLSL